MNRRAGARYERIEVTRDQNRIAEEQTAFLLGLAGGRTLETQAKLSPPSRGEPIGLIFEDLGEGE